MANEIIIIALDDGHGMGTLGKRTPNFTDGTKSRETGKNFMHENEFNRTVVKYLDVELQRHGFKTLLVAPTDADTPLKARTDLANSNKVDAYVSVHANALTGEWGKARGIETFYFEGHLTSKKLAETVHKYLLQGTEFYDRGLKTSKELWVLKQTKYEIPSILVECGFMDNDREARLLMSDSYRKECAIEIAKGLCEYFGKTYKPVSTPPLAKQVYRVRKTWKDSQSQKGAFGNLDSAKELADKHAGYAVFNASGKEIYRPKS